MIDSGAAIEGVTTPNIGHAIIARAVLTGLYEAVRTMKLLMGQARMPSTNRL